MRKLLIAGVLLFSSSHAIAQGNQCDAALVRATYSLANQVGIDWRLADLVDQATYDSVKQSAGANAVIYGVPVGGSWQDFKDRVDTLKKQHNEQLTYNQLTNIAWSGLDPNAPNAYHDCLNAQVLNSNGLHAVVLGATQTDISILVRWSVPGNVRTSVSWPGVPHAILPLFPNSLNQGDLTIIVPRPAQQLSIAANAPGYTTQRIVLEPLPPPAPDVTPKWVTYTSADVPTKDGQGNTVGNLSQVSFELFTDPALSSAKRPYKFHYSYYNGSGTWRGSQTIFVQLLDANRQVLDTLPFGLDRGRCIYNQAEPRGPFQGNTHDINASSVKSVNVVPNAVSGVQTPC